MITVDKHDVGEAIPFKGKSTDTKPKGYWYTEKIVNGSSFFEMDTQQVFFYDGDIEDWLPQP